MGFIFSSNFNDKKPHLNEKNLLECDDKLYLITNSKRTKNESKKFINNFSSYTVSIGVCGLFFLSVIYRKRSFPERNFNW